MDKQTTPIDFGFVKNQVMNEPMLEPLPSVNQLLESITTVRNGSIYYGTGLCTPKFLSVGLPFDVLSMVFVAEKFRRILNFDKIYHMIADTHAKSNNFCSNEEVDRLANATRGQLERLARNFELEHLQVIMSSEYDHTEKYQEFLEWTSSRTDLHEYVKRELADILWFNDEKKMHLKIGWITQSGDSPVGNDERLFDQEFRRISDEPISFFYLKAGRTFDKSRPKASPYISIPGEHRIMLTPGEPVKEKMEAAERELGDKSLGGAKKHLIGIVRLYENLYEKLENLTLDEKIAHIIERACK